MGLLGLPFAEDHGGMGAGPIEVAIVAEEIGRVLAPEPYVEAVGLAGGLGAAAGAGPQEGWPPPRAPTRRRPSSWPASPRGRRWPPPRTPSPAPAGARRPRPSPPRRTAARGRGPA